MKICQSVYTTIYPSFHYIIGEHGDSEYIDIMFSKQLQLKYKYQLSVWNMYESHLRDQNNLIITER